MKEKAQPNAPAVASEPAADVQYSVTTGNKFDGVAEASDDPFEMLDKLSIEAKAPKEKKTEKPVQKDKKKPASAPQKPATANEKPAKKDEKPANANAPKAQEGGKPENKPEGMARGAPRGRGGRIGGPFAGGAGLADEQQPPASAPVHREPPPPPKYDQPRPEGAGAPRGRGGRGFGFGGRGRGFPRGGGPRLAFAEGADTNAASGAAPGGQEGGATGGDDSFVNRGFDTGARHPRAGFRGGGRGGFRGIRGGRGFGRPVADFGAPEVPGGPPVARKREFERHSGSDVTGVRPVDKREGAGAHNWGTVQDDLAGQTAALNESEIAEEGAPTAPPTGEQAAPAEGAEAPKDGEGEKSAEDAAKAEDEKKELTLDEYKAQLQQKLIPKTNFNVRPPEGADLKGLKQVVKKKEDQTEYVEEENTADADADSNKKGAKVSKQPKAAPVKDVGFRYENPQADFGPRGRGRGRGFRGGAGGEGGGFRGGEGGGFRESGGFRPRGRGRFEGGAAPPRLEDEDAFPALNPLGPH